ncbi:uncharacterized protein [Apostichopus japonicus]|uniref:uncharacterized protein isoform X2 n=1 Tax=Stichopus japonicus TaxID=307972 RepID=UPI003AB66359
MSDKQKVDKAEKDSWRVKSLEEIREERKKKQGLLDVTTDTEPVIPMDSVIVLESASSDHEEDGDEGQQRASSGEERIEDDALNIQPPQRQAHKDHKSRRREDKRKHSHRDSDKRRKDKHERKHTGEKHSKHRDYRRERMKEKSSLRGHKDKLSKESGRSVQRPEEEKRKDRREFIPSLVGLRGPGRDFYKPERDQLLGQDRKIVRSDRLDHQEEIFEKQKRDERQREIHWRERSDSRDRPRESYRDPGRGRDIQRDHEERRREEGPRQVEVSRRIVSLVDKRSNNVSKLRADKEGTSSSHQRDRSLLRKAKEENLKESAKEREPEKKPDKEKETIDEEERPVSDFELEKESHGPEGEQQEGEEDGSSEESGDSDGSDDSSEESESSGEEEGEEDKEAVEKEEGEASASDESSSEEEGSEEESEEESAEESEGSEESAEVATANDASASKFDGSPKKDDKEEVEEKEEMEEEEEKFLPASPDHSPIELKETLPAYYPALAGCRNVEEFEHLNKIEEGTYGVVYRAREKRNDEIVALKRLKMEKEKEGFPITSLREINTLLKAQHVNIVTVREIVVGSNMDKIYIVMDYVEHDLKSLMETMKQPFTIGETKCLVQQLLRGVNHLHENWILHRDLKTSNLLLSHKGILKIGDFGLAREYGSPLKQYTPIVVTLWYRAPELLLAIKEYSVKIDMWSVGCIFAEFLTMKPLFPGRSEIDQLNRIFKELGTPSEKIWPGYNELPAVKKMSFTEYPYNNLRNRFGTYLTDLGFDLLNRFLTYNPAKRISAEDALKQEYFKESPQPIDESMFPTWPAKSEQSRTAKRSPKAPEGGMQFNKLGDDESEGFRLTLPTHGTSAVGPGFHLKF